MKTPSYFYRIKFKTSDGVERSLGASSPHKLAEFKAEIEAGFREDRYGYGEPIKSVTIEEVDERPKVPARVPGAIHEALGVD